MRFRLLRVRYIALSLVLIIAVILLLRKPAFSVTDTPFFLNKLSPEGSFESVTAEGSWFPSLAERNKLGAAETWRDPAGVSTASALTGLPDEFEDVLDPIALKTFYMLKTGANVMWDRLPIHLSTTLKRFPYHQIYADQAGIIGEESIIDILASLPKYIILNAQLAAYRVHVENLEKNWGWDASKVKVNEQFEGWFNDKFKNVPMLLHAYRHAPKQCEWFVMADDDTYVMSNSLGSILRKLDPRKPYYIGSPAVIDTPFANEGKVGGAMFKKNPNRNVMMLFAHGGSGIVFSRGTLDALFWDPQREDHTVAKYSEMAIHQCCGDAMMAFVFREELKLFLNAGIDVDDVEVDPFQGNALTDTLIDIQGGELCRRIASWHHLSSSEVNTLHDWETSLAARKRNLKGGILYSDVYHDMLLPFLFEERENWDIRADTDMFEPGDEFPSRFDDEPLHPTSSKEDCKKVCEALPDCLGWTYSTDKCVLKKDGLELGQATNHWSKDWTNSSITSGWLIDKIRQLRSGEECDSLSFDLESETYSDDQDTSEGWYFRKLQLEKETHQQNA